VVADRSVGDLAATERRPPEPETTSAVSTDSRTRPTRRRRGAIRRLLAASALAISGGATVRHAVGESPTALAAAEVRTQPIDLVFVSEPFGDLAELVAAADLVVVGRVRAIGAGRAFTDPLDPTLGIISELAEIDVEAVLVGTAPSTLVIESESTLLDGTPVVVGGVGPPTVAERGVYFLVSGGAADLPYFAIVGPQGRMRVVGSGDDGRIAVVADDPLSASIDGLRLADVVDEIIANRE
jgi:hypothetical protein